MVWVGRLASCLLADFGGRGGVEFAGPVAGGVGCGDGFDYAADGRGLAATYSEFRRWVCTAICLMWRL